MPRKSTGKPPGRPRAILRDDGTPHPVGYKPEPEALRALDAELFFYGLQEKGRADERPWPVLASASRVAKRAGVTPRAVQKWRRASWYENRFWTAVLSRNARQRDAVERERKKPKQIVHEALVAWIWKGWPKEGFVLSPINGRRYHSPETYARHIQAQPGGLKPYDWFQWK